LVSTKLVRDALLLANRALRKRFALSIANHYFPVYSTNALCARSDFQRLIQTGRKRYINHASPKCPCLSKQKKGLTGQAKKRKEARKIFVFSPPVADVCVINPSQADHESKNLCFSGANYNSSGG
jgi:hypothetical protein